MKAMCARGSGRGLPIVLAGSLGLWACGDDGSEPGSGDDTAGSDNGGFDTETPPGGTAADDSGGTGPGGGTEGSDGGSPPPMGALAGDIFIDEVEVNQGVGITIATGGAVAPTTDRVAPVIGGRAALVRASYTLGPDFDPRPIVGRLWLRDGETNEVYTDERMVTGLPDWSTIDGSFSWRVAPEHITGPTEFRVQWLETDPDTTPTGDTSGAQLPADGFAPLDAWGDRMVLDLMVVPFTCTNVPDLDLNANDLADFEAFIFNTYPVQQLRMTVRDSVHSNSCDEFEAAEQILPDLRAADGAAPGVYYGGLMPGNGGGYSIAVQGGDQMAYRRTFASHTWRDFGLTFDLFAHELGHNHGREHSFEDPSFPGDSSGGCGAIDTYGWGPRSALMPSSGWGNDLDLGLSWFDPNDTLLWPTDGSCAGLPEGNRWNFNDIMSYQYPFWVSAHTYAAAANRVALISTWDGADVAPPAVPIMTLVLGPEGSVHRFATTGADVPPPADAASWALCRDDEGSIRIPVRHSTSRSERPTAEGLRSEHFQRYELRVPSGVDPATCVLEDGEAAIRFVAP